MASGFLIYGSYGYAGELIAREALSRGLRPILAGRDRFSLYSQGAKLNLPYRAFGLGDPAVVDAALVDVAAVLHCAGPFAHTYRAMVESCLRTGTHYLDVTGEVAVFEGLHALDGAARSAGVMLLPGVGFSVVASDCLAAHLKRRLPSAARLTLALRTGGHVSRGTAITVVEKLGAPALVRRDGVVVPVPTGWKSRTIDLGRGPVEAVTVPLGDVATAYYSTGIPNVEVYVALPALVRWAMGLARRLGWLLGTSIAQGLLKAWVESGPRGPDQEERASGESLLWGEAEDATGRRAVSRLRCPESHDFTAASAVSAMEKVLAGEVSPGFQTPSQAFGSDFVLTIPGVVREDVT